MLRRVCPVHFRTLYDGDATDAPMCPKGHAAYLLLERRKRGRTDPVAQLPYWEVWTGNEQTSVVLGECEFTDGYLDYLAAVRPRGPFRTVHLGRIPVGSHIVMRGGQRGTIVAVSRHGSAVVVGHVSGMFLDPIVGRLTTLLTEQAVAIAEDSVPHRKTVHVVRHEQ